MSKFWPDLKFPPINLWSVPYMNKKERKEFLKNLPGITAEEAGIDVLADHVDMNNHRKQVLKEGNNAFLDMWFHKCPIEGAHLVGKGEPCNWCGELEDV